MNLILSLSLNFLSLCKPARERSVWITIQKQRILRNPDFPYTPLWFIYLFILRINRIAALKVLHIIHYLYPNAWSPLFLILRFYVLEYANISKAQLCLNRWLANSSDPASPLISNRLRLFQFDEGRTSSGQYISNYVFSPNFFENKSRIIKYSCHSEELSLYIDLPGYIGNFIIQLLNAIFLARIYNISCIYILPTETVVANFSNKFLAVTKSNIRLIFGVPQKGIAIASSFVNLDCLPKDVVKPSFRTLSSEIARQFCSTSNKISSASSLTIHIRSGDIFGYKAFYYPSYGQPPLAYYILCIEYQKPSSVNLVYEDLANPVIEELISYLQNKNIHFSLVSGSVENDFKTLVSARNLVLSFGTFGPMSICFNNSLVNIYTFNENNHQLVSECMSSHSFLFNIMDSKGQYVSEVLSDNWGNTEYQRELMLSYSMKNLRILR